MEGYSCIKNRGVHEDQKHDEDCEGGEKWDLPFVLESWGPRLRRCPLNSKLLYENQFHENSSRAVRTENNKVGGNDCARLTTHIMGPAFATMSA